MKHAIGIDLGGTRIKSAIVSEKGKIIEKKETATFTPPKGSKVEKKAAISTREEVLDKLVCAVKYLQKFAQKNDITIEGVGVGSPGTPGKYNKILVYNTGGNIDNWHNVPVGTVIEEKTGLPTWIDNDANMMGLGEARFGAGKGYDDIIFITVGTGIGGAILRSGKIDAGYQNRGSELGHIPIHLGGRLCGCGSRGCLEAYASTANLVRMYAEGMPEESRMSVEELNGKYIVEKYKEKEPLAVEQIRQHCHNLGSGIAGFVNIFAPQKVVIGGGISEAGDFYIKLIKKSILNYASPICSAGLAVSAAQLGNKAGSLGAAAMAFDFVAKKNAASQLMSGQV